MNAQLTDNYFRLFELEPRYGLDIEQLDSRYKAFQHRHHPDKAVHLAPKEQRASLERATLANEAYRTLKHPLERARYLLQLHDVTPLGENSTATDVEFLLQQMDLREELSDAVASGVSDTLAALEARVRLMLADLAQQVAELLDGAQDYPRAAERVSRMRFLDKLAAEISLAMDAVEY